MGDIPSRSFKEGFLEGTDEQFLAHFTNRFPIPLPFSPNSQPGSWRLVTPPSGIVSAMISLLQKAPGIECRPNSHYWQLRLWYSASHNQDPRLLHLQGEPDRME
jgi:hypothetical protein